MMGLHVSHLQSLIQENAHVEVDPDGELARASVLLQDIDPFLFSGGNSGPGMIGSDYVYSRATGQLRASLAAEPIHEDDDQEAREERSGDIVSGFEQQLPAAWTNPTGSFHLDVGSYAIKSGGRSVSDDTDRSFSVASDQSCDESSPPPSPLFGSSIKVLSSLSSTLEFSYEQRIEATLSESMGKRLEQSGGSETAGSATAESPTTPTVLQQFTMSDIAHFDAHFGRELYIEQLGKSFVDGSGSKSLASYRMSSYHRMSMATDIIKQGWLVKRGEVVPSWHRRWFTLRRMYVNGYVTVVRYVLLHIDINTVCLYDIISGLKDRCSHTRATIPSRRRQR